MANCTLRRTMWKSEGAKRFKNVWVISNNNVYENHPKYITYFNYRAKVKKKKELCLYHQFWKYFNFSTKNSRK